MSNTGKRSIVGIYNGLKQFFEEELWLKDTAALPTAKRALFSVCRVVMIVVRGFRQDNCSLQASALTYITLVSMVPMLAIMFSFTKGIGMQKKLLGSIGIERVHVVEPGKTAGKWEYVVIKEEKTAVEENAPGAPNESQQDGEPRRPGFAKELPLPMQEALIKILLYVDNTNFAAMGIVGFLMLLFSVICSIAKLEDSLNNIWGVKQSRTFLRKCSEYLVVLILMPIVFLLATSMNTIIMSNGIMLYLQAHLGSIAYLIQMIVRVIGLFFMLSGFVFFFMFMPNTKVKLLPALAGGVISGALWFGVQWAYLSLQIGLTRFNSIYGTFAVVPFFLAWLYANWSILLVGAEISFAIQNHRTIHLEKASESASTGICIVLGQLILFEVCKSFHAGNGALAVMDFAQEHSIPVRVVQHVLAVMSKAGIIVKVAGEQSKPESYLPGRDIACLSPADVEEAFRQNQSLDTKLYLQNLPSRLRENYAHSYETYCQSLSGMTFDKLIISDTPKEAN